MSQIIIAKTGEDRYCLVKVPEGAYRFYSAKDGIVSGSVGMDVSKRLPDGALSLTGDRINIEKGNWQIVGIGRELSHEQCASIVESELTNSGNENSRVYKDYEKQTGNDFYSQSEYSLFSWLRSHGADETFLILKEVK